MRRGRIAGGGEGRVSREGDNDDDDDDDDDDDGRLRKRQAEPICTFLMTCTVRLTRICQSKRKEKKDDDT